MESGFSSSAGSTLFRDQVDPVFFFPPGKLVWKEGCLSLHLASLHLFVFLCLCQAVSSSQVPSGSVFPLPSTSFDTTPRVTIVQTPDTDVETQLYGLLHVLSFKDTCLILVLFRFVIMHAWNVLMFIFLSVPFLCFTSVMPRSKVPAFIHGPDTRISNRHGQSLWNGLGTFNWLNGRKYLHLISKPLSWFLFSWVRMNRLSLKVLEGSHMF